MVARMLLEVIFFNFLKVSIFSGHCGGEVGGGAPGSGGGGGSAQHHQTRRHRHRAQIGEAAAPHHAHHGLRAAAVPATGRRCTARPREGLHETVLERVSQGTVFIMYPHIEPLHIRQHVTKMMHEVTSLAGLWCLKMTFQFYKQLPPVTALCNRPTCHRSAPYKSAIHILHSFLNDKLTVTS